MKLEYSDARVKIFPLVFPRNYRRSRVSPRHGRLYKLSTTLHRRVRLHFYASYGYASISFTIYRIRAYRQRCSRPFAYTCPRTPPCIHVHAGTYGQPVAAQFLRKFPPRLPKLTPIVNHSLREREVHASPNRFPIYDAKRCAAAARLFPSSRRF